MDSTQVNSTQFIAATAMEGCMVCSDRISILLSRPRHRGQGCVRVPWRHPKRGLRCAVKGRSVSQSSQTEVFLESINDIDGSIGGDIAGAREEVRGVVVYLCGKLCG